MEKWNGLLMQAVDNDAINYFDDNVYDYLIVF